MMLRFSIHTVYCLILLMGSMQDIGMYDSVFFVSKTDPVVAPLEARQQ